MDFFGVRSVGLQVAGDAIVETHSQRQEQIGFLDGMVDPGFAVHAHHPQVQRVAGREAADAQQG